MRNWIKKRKVNFVFLLLGGIGGFCYWKFVGCSSGSCPITSHWYASMLYGMLLGWLVGDLILSFKKENPKV